MFYIRENSQKFYLKSDKTIGEYWPFEGIFAKNLQKWKVPENFNFWDFPAYKFAIWFTKTRVFIISENGEIEIKNLLPNS